MCFTTGLSAYQPNPRYHILACEEHGNWNGSEPVCQRKYCGKPDIPGNADITSMDFYCGDQTGFTCDEGESAGFNTECWAPGLEDISLVTN